jgi:hypothetical protein
MEDHNPPFDTPLLSDFIGLLSKGPIGIISVIVNRLRGRNNVMDDLTVVRIRVIRKPIGCIQGLSFLPAMPADRATKTMTRMFGSQPMDGSGIRAMAFEKILTTVIVSLTLPRESKNDSFVVRFDRFINFYYIIHRPLPHKGYFFLFRRLDLQIPLAVRHRYEMCRITHDRSDE